ncbi:MAG: hypothetical protein A2508_09220 [Candidatus Lambdaproteobacteria bacterium RIFOXYD12_FULL_49_8]|uniref:Cytochrome c domain-containing protein n=1 Tax=Candidatus Lambdaproteobacteria bacterium RIFOXYD2_FULL_50_16 TaxID=1817772 RepID=A0A1F6GEY1_9PROT|nr:MAG: hypothetical protein A2527_03720 [Candidatus Lambdaproteobacteria bacterium RIFOXYD2_FULL_50_16]OGG97731.1 MAG: hypothetical protein A2508_09220 [Candidatus Lambdaproteobacteria bacterium RIFOXYD12_FULL_49_8]
MKKSAILILALLTMGIVSAYAEDGERIFKRRGCPTCHGSAGASPISPAYPVLAGQNKDYIVAQLHAFKDKHRDGTISTRQMTPFANSLLNPSNHSEADVDGVASYLAGSTSKAKFDFDSALAAQGKTLYEEKTCNSCHGADAKSPIMPNYPKLAGLSPAYIELQILAFQKGNRKGTDNANLMGGMANSISTEEAKAIANYLGSLQ